MSNLKTYMFRERSVVTEETSVKAKNYDDALDLFIYGEGVVVKTDSEITSYDCIDNPDNLEENDNEWRIQ